MDKKDIKTHSPADEEEDDDGTQGWDEQAGKLGSHDEDLLQHDQKEEGGEEGEAGTGGVAGEIEFRYKDPYSVSPRDDQLPPEEIKRLLIVHKDQHKGHVDKQKQTRKERAAFKEGKVLYNKQNQGRGFSQGGLNNFKTHPIALKAQFSGIDKQMSQLPTNNEAVTNDQLRNELQNRLELQLGLTHKLSSAPKLRPLG